MIDIKIVLWLMLAHYIADFVLQTDWQARNKSSNYTALTTHVVVYSIFMSAATIFYMPTLLIAQVWLVLTFVLHWCTDWATSRWSKVFFTRGDFHRGFEVVGLDQYIHLVCLVLATHWAMLQ